MTGKTTILIADDEDDVRELVGMNLRRAGYATEEAENGLEALRMVRQRRPDAIVLDLMMPGCDGFHVCEELRKQEAHSDLPIIMLTAKGTAQDRIAGLQKGADDYIAKPFSPKELVLRIQAVLRRSALSAKGAEFTEGPFHFELASVKLTLDGVLTNLTLLEFKLLHLLASNRGEVVGREMLLKEVWGHSGKIGTRTLDTHVKRLREKLGVHSDWIRTSRGFGYVFKTPQEHDMNSD